MSRAKKFGQQRVVRSEPIHHMNGLLGASRLYAVSFAGATYHVLSHEERPWPDLPKHGDYVLYETRDGSVFAGWVNRDEGADNTPGKGRL